MGKMGRPTKMTPEVEVRVLAMVRDGASMKDAAAAVGIDRRNLQRHRTRRPQFRRALLSAKAGAKVEAIACLLHAARKGEWKAAAWYLERQFPSEWGRINREVATSGPVSIKWPAFEVVPMPGPEPRQDLEFEWVEDGQPEAKA